MKVLKCIYHLTARIFYGFVGFCFSFFPIQRNKIVFQNFGGKGYGDNPKYIAEEMLKQNKRYRLVWLVTDIHSEFPKEIKKVKYGSIRSYYELATAKVWIDNIRNGLRVRKKKKQFYIQTWHGSIPLKKIERAAEELLDKSYIRKAKRDGKRTDLMLSNSKWSTDLYHRDFWYNGRVLEKGVPREDILVQDSTNFKLKVLNFFTIPKTKKIILYAPTFREVRNMEVFNFQYEEVIKAFETRFNEEFVLFIRLHPNDSVLYNNIVENDKVRNVSSYPDMQELLLASDILLTDYSSTMFEFSAIHRKVFLFMKDLSQYLKTEREMYFNIMDLPFPIAQNEEELLKHILEFDEEQYNNNIQRFLSDIAYFPLGNASKEVVQYIENIVERKKNI